MDIGSAGTLINKYGGCEWGSRQSLYAQITTRSIYSPKVQADKVVDTESAPMRQIAH
jgi:hypothetical protein